MTKGRKKSRVEGKRKRAGSTNEEKNKEAIDDKGESERRGSRRRVDPDPSSTTGQEKRRGGGHGAGWEGNLEENEGRSGSRTQRERWRGEKKMEKGGMHKTYADRSLKFSF